MITIDSIRTMLVAVKTAETKEQRDNILDVIDKELEEWEEYFNNKIVD